MASVLKIPTEFTAVDKFSGIISKMTGNVNGFSNSTTAAIDRFNSKANKIAGNMAIAGGAIMAPLGYAVKKAIDFEDKMADVAKTTNLSATESDAFGKAILDMSKKTRTSIEALQDIGIVGGTIGVAKDELVSFTKAGNEFSIALGSSFSGGTEEAVTQVAKLKGLFKETRDLKVAEALNKTGSAINEIENVAGSARNIADFGLRIGALPDALKPAQKDVLALGGFLEDAGLSSEIAAGGFSNLLLVAGKNLPAFAIQMDVSLKKAKEMLATDPTQFAVDFSKSLSKLKPDALAKKLEKLKIGSQETIKVVGALGSGFKKLAEVQDISKKAFDTGTSMTAEAAKKNETMAGKLAIAKNNMDALSITIGTQLAPILTDLIGKITPIIEGVTKWAEENPGFARTLLFVGGAMLGLSFGLKAVTFAMTIGQGAIALYTFLLGIYEGVALTAALTGSSFAAVIWATLAPILLVVAVIAALIGLIYLIITKWDEWGAALTLFMGPLGLIIMLIQSFRKNWDMIVNAFKTDGIIGGLKAIGATILDAVLFPLQQLLGLIAKIPGMGDIMAPAIEGLNSFRESLGVNMEGTTKIEKLDSPEQVNAKVMQENRLSGGLNVNIKDKGNNVESTSPFGNSGIPVNVTSTQGSF